MIASSLVAAISTSGIRWCRTVLLLALWRGPPEGTSDIWNFVYTWDISTSIKDSKRSNHFWYLLGRHLGFLVKDLLPLICNPAIFRKCHQSASRYRLWRWKWIRIGNPVSTRSPQNTMDSFPCRRVSWTALGDCMRNAVVKCHILQW